MIYVTLLSLLVLLIYCLFRRAEKTGHLTTNLCIAMIAIVTVFLGLLIKVINK